MGFWSFGRTGTDGMESLGRRVTRTVTRCLVCGSSEVRTDEVIDRGVVMLAECPRCEHRWTALRSAAPLGQPLPKLAPTASREVATAA